MNCGKPHEWIEAEVDGELDAEAQAALDRHAEGCEACKKAREDALFSRDQFDAVDLEEVPGSLSQTLDARLDSMYELRRKRREDKARPWWAKLAELLSRPRSLAMGAAALSVLLFVALQSSPKPGNVGMGVPVMHVAGAPAPVESPEGLGLHRGAYLVTRVETGRHLRSVSKDTVLTLAQATMVLPEKSELFFASDGEDGSPTQALQLQTGRVWVASAPGDGFRVATSAFECFAASGSLFEMAMDGVRVFTGSVRLRRRDDETLVRAGFAFAPRTDKIPAPFARVVPDAIARALSAALPITQLAHYLPRSSDGTNAAGSEAGDETPAGETPITDGAGDRPPASTLVDPATGKPVTAAQVDALSGLMGGKQ